jgi:drug/metabolite transporter (DMT)-like permease
MGILLGLLTAVAWGSSDFLARFATRRLGTLRTVFYMQFVGLLFLTLFMHPLGGWGHLADGSGWHPWAWGLLAGTLNTLSMLALYRSFEIGKMSVVAPLSASYPALTLAFSFLSGEHLTAFRLAGIVCALLGVLLVAGGEKPPGNPDTAGSSHSGKGIGWALCSALGFGLLFWLLGIRIIPAVGAIPAVWTIRLTGAAITGVALLLWRRPLGLPWGKSPYLVLGMGALDTGAFAFSNRGMQMEQVAVVSVLGSLYGAVTVVLAAVFLRERPAFLQWLGIASIFAGIFLISR